ncbi:MAG: nuclear transport factor 2 family protein [Spirulina sp. SIO3F2]|nr:nuclear transport factor 2 family protein [Spirulina sp. SIO3F2]
MLTIHPNHTALKCLVQDYFSTLNARDYYETSLLFTEQGELLPPFDDVIQGQDAIAHYLSQEATHMTCSPQAVEVLTANQLLVRGRVQTALFEVSVIWQFQFDSHQRIERLRIELVASLEDLLTIKTHHPVLA